MPIRKEQRSRYPSAAEWREIKARIRKRATGEDGITRCERCRKPDRELVRTTWDGTGRWAPLGASLNPGDPHWTDGQGHDGVKPPTTKLHETLVVLAVVHLNHQPESNGDDNLQCLCQGCHLRHDRPVHQFWRRLTLRSRRAPQDQRQLDIQAPLAMPSSLEIGPQEEARLEAVGAQ